MDDSSSKVALFDGVDLGASPAEGLSKKVTGQGNAINCFMGFRT